MDRSNVLTLIGETFTQDINGVFSSEETTATVFCDVSSVSLNEWTEGGRIGLNPEKRFTVFAYDYHGEEICEFDGVRYSIYRTYFGRDDTIELYAERRIGAEPGENPR